VSHIYERKSANEYNYNCTYSIVLGLLKFAHIFHGLDGEQRKINVNNDPHEKISCKKQKKIVEIYKDIPDINQKEIDEKIKNYMR